jgi:Tfp pilus assembly major pilin PilA
VSAVSQSRKILIDNGAPNMDLNLVLNSDAGASLRTLYGINTDRDWSSAPMSQQGVLATPHGVSIRETGQPVAHTAGTVTDTTVTGANAVGTKAIGVTTAATTGDVTVTAGDVITIAGDSNQYVVAAGVTIGAGTTGTITIQEPGLRVATTGSEAISIVSDFNANVAFYRGAIQLVTRAPALPQEGDMAIDTMMLQDPRSGLAFEVRVYPGYRKVRYEIGLAWGVKVTQARHTALLLG